MSKAHYFYSPYSVDELKTIVESHQDEFACFLEETFSEEELSKFEHSLDTLAAVYVQPMISELSFEDLNSSASLENEQRDFFLNCRSSICIENLPDLETNPFQVSYLIQLLGGIGDVIVDQGGMSELVFKTSYLEELQDFRSMESIISSPKEKKLILPSAPVGPMDHLVLDVYRELERLEGKRDLLLEHIQTQSEKVQRLFQIMDEVKLDSLSLLRKSGLNTKDFGDGLERLKFGLKKLS